MYTTRETASRIKILKARETQCLQALDESATTGTAVYPSLYAFPCRYLSERLRQGLPFLVKHAWAKAYRSAMAVRWEEARAFGRGWFTKRNGQRLPWLRRSTWLKKPTG
jgi:hypothetical protein